MSSFESLVLESLSYDQETGDFRWNSRTADSGNNRRWNARNAGRRAGSKSSDGYVQISIGGKNMRAHRLAWFIAYGQWPAGQIDHIDGNRLNNKINNLRAATSQQNNRNKRSRSDNASGYRGVSWDRCNKKWQAYIGVGNKNKSLGKFDRPEDAARAYQMAAAELFGDFFHGGNR